VITTSRPFCTAFAAAALNAFARLDANMESDRSLKLKAATIFISGTVVGLPLSIEYRRSYSSNGATKTR
jgi:hypothetical protein